MWNDSGSESPYLDYCNQYELKHYCFGDGGGGGGGGGDGETSDTWSNESQNDSKDDSMDMDAMSTDAPALSAEEAADPGSVAAHQEQQEAIDEDPASWEAAQMDDTLATDQYGRAIGTTYGYLGTTATSDRDAPGEWAEHAAAVQQSFNDRDLDVNVTAEKGDYGWNLSYTGPDAWAATVTGLGDLSSTFSLLGNIQAAFDEKDEAKDEEAPSPETSLYDPSVQIDTGFDPSTYDDTIEEDDFSRGLAPNTGFGLDVDARGMHSGLGNTLGLGKTSTASAPGVDVDLTGMPTQDVKTALMSLGTANPSDYDGKETITSEAATTDDDTTEEEKGTPLEEYFKDQKRKSIYAYKPNTYLSSLMQQIYPDKNMEEIWRMLGYRADAANTGSA